MKKKKTEKVLISCSVCVCTPPLFVCIYMYMYIRFFLAISLKIRLFSFPYRLRVYFGLSPRLFFPDKIRAKMKREKKKSPGKEVNRYKNIYELMEKGENLLHGG